MDMMTIPGKFAKTGTYLSTLSESTLFGACRPDRYNIATGRDRRGACFETCVID